MKNKIGHKFDGEYYEVVKPGSLAERAMISARKNIYREFLDLCKPNDSESIIDVGVSDIIESGDNMLERQYPHKNKITAAGLGPGSGFRAAFPEVNYVQILQGEPLPFRDKSFSIAVSNAVLEHIGSIPQQKYFIKELIRISKRVFISIPNRFFPLEHHTALPFLAWNDSAFRLGCKLTKKEKWARSENLILIDMKSLRSLMPENVRVTYRYAGLRLGLFSSNICACIENS